MLIGAVKIKIHANWVHSLKEKRMVVKSLCSKIRNKFNVSIAEVEEQDLHQIIVIGFACVANESSQADSIIDHVIDFIEANTEGQITQIERELI